MRLNEEDEVVISNHVYNYFKHFGYIYEYNNLSDKISARDMTPEKLIGKTLNIHINGTTHNFKISGIIDTNFNTDRYDKLKNSLHDYMLYMLEDEYSRVLN